MFKVTEGEEDTKFKSSVCCERSVCENKADMYDIIFQYVTLFHLSVFEYTSSRNVFPTVYLPSKYMKLKISEFFIIHFYIKYFSLKGLSR